MTRYEAEEHIEIISLLVILSSFIFVMIGVTKPISFLSVSCIIVFLNIVAWYLFNIIDNKES